MSHQLNICVYCGSRTGHAPDHIHVAKSFGKAIGERGWGLIFGGGHVGMMGAVADATLQIGGKATGIIPGFLTKMEVMHSGLTEAVIVETMHERKKAMIDRSSACVALPGGFGTLDELIELITWKLLKLHDKPIIIINSSGYWEPLVSLFEHIIENGFAGADDASLYSVVPDVPEAISLLEPLAEKGG